MKQMTDEQIAVIAMDCALASPSDLHFARSIIEARDKQWREALDRYTVRDCVWTGQRWQTTIHGPKVRLGTTLSQVESD